MALQRSKLYSSSKNTSTNSNTGTKRATVEKTYPQIKKSEVDTDSVLALGYGPISASELNSLEERGIIESYVSDGKIKYRNVASKFTNQMVFR